MHILINVLIAAINAINLAIAEEFCNGEIFKPQCSTNEVIIMKQALFGRMSVGRCVDSNKGLCSTDVLFWMDSKCSGKQTWELKIPNFELMSLLTSCSKDFMPYLDAEYSCHKMAPFEKKDCHNHNSYQVTSQPSLLSSTMLHESKCAIPEQPLSLQARIGQRINITFYDFNWNPNKKYYKQCLQKYGYIIDAKSSEMLEVCGGTARIKNLYISKDSMVQLVFQKHILEEKSFLIEFHAVGCPDFTPPADAWMTQEGSTITVGCHGSHDRWKLQCDGARWQGIHGTCTHEAAAVLMSTDNSGPKVSNVIALTLIIGATAVICCVSVTSILVCFYYRKYKPGDLKAKETEYYSTASIAGAVRSAPTMATSSGTIKSYRSFRPVSIVTGTQNRQTLLRSSGNANDDETQLVNINGIPESSLLNEVIYDDPVNLIDDSVQYVNTGNVVNSLQYTKLQK